MIIPPFLTILFGLVAAGCALRAIYLGVKIREERDFEYRHRFHSLPRARRQGRQSTYYLNRKKRTGLKPVQKGISVKTILIIVSVFALGVGLARAGEDEVALILSIRRRAIEVALRVPVDSRYRIIGEKVYDLNEYARMVKVNAWQISASENAVDIVLDYNYPGFDDWTMLSCKVIQVLGEDGLLLRTYPIGKSDYAERKTIRLKNYRALSALVDGDQMTVFAKHEPANYRYKSTDGAMATVASYDYGKIPNSDELNQLLKLDAGLQASKLQAIQAANQAELERRKKAQQEKDAITKLKVIAFRLEQASNNVPRAQYDLAQNYLHGDGVESNHILGVYWLTRAATNGNSEAREELKTIR